MGTINIPVEYDTDEKKPKYLARAQEKYRLIHIAMGKWMKAGLTQNQWDKFPAFVKTEFSYEPKLPLARFKYWEYDWKFGYDKTALDEISFRYNILVDSFAKDETIDVDLDKVLS